jgi:uncharacterized protein YqjF (DUF2071 family)
MPSVHPFLTAQWRNLLMLNYAVDPALVEPFLPAGTALDLWHNRAYISLVGFQFQKTRLRGWAVPFYQYFAEVNLRFYVRREAADGWRRGVVFLKEIVPKLAVTWVANAIYHEHYVTLPMSQRIQLPASAADRTGLADYRWKYRGRDFAITANFSGLPQQFRPGSEEEFITEHYWGYTKWPDDSTWEYRVDHPPWHVWRTDSACFSGDATELYGVDFAAVLNEPPCSSLVAEGSAVTVSDGERLGLADHSGNGFPLVSGASQMIPRPMM